MGAYMLSHFSHVRLFVILWACQAPLSMWFSRQEKWSVLSCPPPGDFPDLGIQPTVPGTPTSQVYSLPLNHWGIPLRGSVQFSSVAQSCLTLCDPMNCSTPGLLSITNSQSWLKLIPIESVMPTGHLILCCPLLLLPPTPPSIRVFSNNQLFAWGGQSTGVSIKHQPFQWTSRTDLLSDELVGFPCSPRDSQESSPTPQFRSINFSALSFLHSPTLTSIHDHWKNHSLDQTDLCCQSNVSAF